ncbi:O-antigen ligase family protein [uncultured Vibrio sp.]|uniref:O-antigen ligase family protein n=1 Tax=uncultured Vibrio sp. TaxID=114054 RepID=UPI002AA957CC|nr:O-antigen ligase family protein [uncultured Vibrio sp.]
MLNIGYLLYLSVLIFAPVALGATHIWAKMPVETIVFLSLFCVLFHTWRTGSPLRKVPALWPAIGFVFWIALQLVPLPSGLLAFVSPAAHELYATAHGPSEPSFWAPITVKPQFTAQELFRFAAFVAYYFLTVQLLDERQRLKQALTIALGVAGLLAFQGIIQSFAGNGKIFWLFDPGPMASFGAFYYRNHFAGFMAMLLPVALVLFLYYRPRSGSGIPLRQRIIHILDQLKQSPSFRYGLISIFIFVAILLSQSRTGISVAVLTSGFMLLWSRKLFRLHRISPALLAALAIIALLFVGRTGFDQIDARFGEAVNQEGLTMNAKTISGRTGPWQDCLHLVGDFPLTGAGFGSFFSIYPSYNLSGTHTPRQAHNDYLETAIDGGLIALALVATFLVLFLRPNYGMFRLRRDNYTKHLYVGSLTGIVALLLHSITEYQFRQTTAIPLYFFFLLGVHTVAVHSRKAGSTRGSLLPDIPLNKKGLLVISCGLLLLAPLNILFHGGEIAALSAGATQSEDGLALLNLSPDTNKETLLERNQKSLQATGYDRLNPIYPTSVAYSAQLLGNAEMANNYYRRALLLDPANANTLQLYGEFLSGQDRLEDAQRLLQASVARDINSTQRLLVYVLWLLGQEDAQKGVLAARAMLEEHPQLSSSFYTILENSPLPPELIPQTLPERVQPYLAYAALLEKRGLADGAATTYDLALSYMDQEEDVKPAHFAQPLRFFRIQKDEDRILAVLKKAVNRLPNEFSFHLQLGDQYARQGMNRKAVEEYRMALQLKPDERRVQQRIEDLTVE